MKKKAKKKKKYPALAKLLGKKFSPEDTQSNHLEIIGNTPQFKKVLQFAQKELGVRHINNNYFCNENILAAKGDKGIIFMHTSVGHIKKYLWNKANYPEFIPSDIKFFNFKTGKELTLIGAINNTNHHHDVLVKIPGKMFYEYKQVRTYDPAALEKIKSVIKYVREDMRNFIIQNNKMLLNPFLGEFWLPTTELLDGRD